MLSIDIRDVDGRTLEELAQVIQLRQRELKETAENAVRATAIRTLTSLRSLTRKANPRAVEASVRVRPADGFTAGWRTVGGVRRRCLKYGGRAVTDRPFVSLMPRRYLPGEDPLVFVAVDLHYPADDRVYYLIARSIGEAREYAQNRAKKRIEKWAGLARLTLAACQNKISTRSGVEKAGSAIWAVAQKNAAVHVESHGFNSGSLAIEVLDRLRYASLALQNGPADVNLALQKAVNSVTGMINARLGWKKFATPFPDI